MKEILRETINYICTRERSGVKIKHKNPLCLPNFGRVNCIQWAALQDKIDHDFDGHVRDELGIGAQFLA
jgi:hypothetical protein